MAVEVVIPTPLRQFTAGEATVTVPANTVAGVLASLATQHPELRANLLTDAGELHPFLHLFVNGQDIASAGGLETDVPEGGEVLIVQAISGG